MEVLLRCWEQKHQGACEIKLEDADYKWLVENFKSRAPSVFGINTYVIYEALTDTMSASNVTDITEARRKTKV